MLEADQLQVVPLDVEVFWLNVSKTHSQYVKCYRSFYMSKLWGI